MQELEIAIHRHQSLYEQVTQAYTEVDHRHTQQPAGLIQLTAYAACLSEKPVFIS